MPETETATDTGDTVTEAAGADTGTADLAAALRENAILKAGVALDSDAGKLLIANPAVDIASVLALSAPPTPPPPATPNADQIAALQAAQVATQNDALAAAATAARSGLAAGGVGDVGAPDVHPMVLAKQAINDGVTKQHLSRQDAVALGVAQIMNAAVKGDPRVNYVGRVAPGA